jgi:uncharacterized protein YjbJ (UPF0337 family)
MAVRPRKVWRDVEQNWALRLLAGSLHGRTEAIKGSPAGDGGPCPERSDVSDVDHRKFGNIGAAIMGSTADKASGLANEAVGKAKQGIGNVVGSDKLKTEGAAQELKGDAQKATGDAKSAVKDAANKTANAINKNL